MVLADAGLSIHSKAGDIQASESVIDKLVDGGYAYLKLILDWSAAHPILLGLFLLFALLFYLVRRITGTDRLRHKAEYEAIRLQARGDSRATQGPRGALPHASGPHPALTHSSHDITPIAAEAVDLSDRQG